MSTKKQITINSTINIYVTPDLKVKDLSIKDGKVNNSLRAVINWEDQPVLIKMGVHTYNAKIKEWKTVQALSKINVLTIGATVATNIESATASVNAENFKSALADKEATREDFKKDLGI